MKQMNKNFGGALIVAGTAIGAGMLALPIVSSSMGFGYSVIAMTVMWLLSLLSAFVSIEVILHYGRNDSIPHLCGYTLGKTMEAVGAISLLVLLYSVLSAYISGLSSIISSNISLLNIGNGYVALIITLIVGYIVFLRTSVVDYANRILFFAKNILFFLVVFTFIPHINFEYFSTKSSLQHFPEITLVFFTSFGFHGSIPAVMKYVGNDIKSLRKVFFIGSVIPLITYIIWQFVTLGVLPEDGDNSFKHVMSNNQSVGVFIKDLSAVTKKDALKLILDSFSILAMLTSVFGVVIGLIDYILEMFQHKVMHHKKLKAVILSLVIPLAFAVFYPSGFIMALNFAAIALVILAVILPVFIALKANLDYGVERYHIINNKFLLYLLLVFAMVIITMRIIEFL